MSNAVSTSKQWFTMSLTWGSSLFTVVLLFFGPEVRGQTRSDAMEALTRQVLSRPRRDGGKLIVFPFRIPCCSNESVGDLLGEEFARMLAKDDALLTLSPEQAEQIRAWRRRVSFGVDKLPPWVVEDLLGIIKYDRQFIRRHSILESVLGVGGIVACEVIRPREERRKRRSSEPESAEISCRMADPLTGKVVDAASAMIFLDALADRSPSPGATFGREPNRRWRPLDADAQKATATHFIEALFAGRADEARRALSPNAAIGAGARFDTICNQNSDKFGRFLGATASGISWETSRYLLVEVDDNCDRSKEFWLMLSGTEKVLAAWESVGSCDAARRSSEKSGVISKAEQERLTDIFDRSAQDGELHILEDLWHGGPTSLFSFCRPRPSTYCPSSPSELTHVIIWTRFTNGELPIAVTLNDAGEVEYMKFGHGISYPNEDTVGKFRDSLRERATNAATVVDDLRTTLPSFASGVDKVTPGDIAKKTLTNAASAIMTIAELENGRPLREAVKTLLQSLPELPEPRRCDIATQERGMITVEAVDSASVMGALDRMWSFARKLLDVPDVAPTIHVQTRPAGALFKISDRSDPTFVRAPLLTDGEIRHVWLGQYVGALEKDGFAPVTIDINLVDDPRHRIECELVAANTARASSCWMTEGK